MMSGRLCVAFAVLGFPPFGEGARKLDSRANARYPQVDPAQAGLLQTKTAAVDKFWPSTPCVYKVFEGKDAKDNLLLGTPDNMDPRLAALGLDLGGLWWLKGNPVPEVLASFAGSIVNDSSFPVLLEVPNSLKEHWSWTTSPAGTSLVKFYSAFSPQETMKFDMLSATEGEIDTALKTNPAVLVENWGFYKLNNDQWNRTTEFQDKSVFDYISGDHAYEMTRILNADGSPTKFWNEYLNSDDGKAKQQAFATDNECLRKCRIAVLSCYLCNRKCGTR